MQINWLVSISWGTLVVNGLKLENNQYSYTNKIKLKYSTKYLNGSIQRSSFTSIQNKPWKVFPEWTRFLIGIFIEIGQNRNPLTSILTEHLRNIIKSKSNDQSKTKNTKGILKRPPKPIFGSKPRKNLKRKILKLFLHSGLNWSQLFLHRVLNWSSSCVKISRNFYLLLNRTFTK